MKKYEVTADYDYVLGHLRHGHVSLKLDESELKLFRALSDEEQLEHLSDHGDLVIDDWEVNDYGELESIGIIEIK